MPKPLRVPGLAGLLAGVAGLLPAASAAAWDIVPHRAIYDLDLASARSSADVTDVGGQMLFEWGDSCDGWTVEQRYRMDFLYSEGQQLNITSAYATWESKDGAEFTFNLRNTTNGQTDKEIRGSAEQDPAGGTAAFRQPEATDIDLPPGILFPTAHTLEMLTRAEAGDVIFRAELFDGTDETRTSDVNTVIGRRIAPGADPGQNALLRDHPSWPVSMAFFDTAETAETPEYEMSVRLYDNGIIDRMLINYGDFTVRARLTQLEPLQPPDC